MDIEFEWDDNKDFINTVKHGISFVEAKMVFVDPLRVDIFDREHSDGEERWKVFGFAGGVLIVVSCTMDGNVIRIIFARKLTKKETEAYYYGYY